MSKETTQRTIAPVHTFGNSTIEGQQVELLVTIAFHPDTSRIGQSVSLGTRREGGAYGEAFFQISRLQPEFPDGKGLDLKWISRSGILDIEVTKDAVRFQSVTENPSLRIEGFGDDLSKRRPIGVLRKGITVHLTAGCVLILREVPLLADMGMPGVLPELYPGCSPESRRLRQLLYFASEHGKAAVLIGENGVGKERAANAIHKTRSKSAVKPLILDTPSIQPSESTETLFGRYESPDAEGDGHLGVFRQAFESNTTLILKHIDLAMPPVQRQLQSGIDGRVAPVGDTPRDGVDVPVLATATTPFEKLDLFAPLKARLQQVIVIPPLRDRPEDIALAIAEHMVANGSPQTADFDFDDIETDEEAMRWWGKEFYKLLTDGRLADWPANYWDLHRFASGMSYEGSEETEAEKKQAVTSVRTREPKSLDDLSDEVLAQLAEQFEYNYHKLIKQLKTSTGHFYRRVEAHPDLRTSDSLTLQEIQVALTENDGDYKAAAKRLRISVQALKAKQTQLKKASE